MSKPYANYDWRLFQQQKRTHANRLWFQHQQHKHGHGHQAVILRAGAGALGSLRNVISAHAEAAVSGCPERGWDKLLRFLCATANDCWQLVSDALPAVEERHPQAMSGERG